MTKTFFIITIDTEEDQWGITTEKPSVENIKSLIQVQKIFDNYGAFPTYLVNYPVVVSDLARGILLDFLSKGRCEIGTHCHPWNNPPFKEMINNHNSMLSNLPYDLIMKKMETLHEAIVNRFKITPISFRAGRYGFGPNVAQCIYKLGYRIDTSVTPFFEWIDEGGPDFREAPTYAYWFEPNDVLHENKGGGLLEVPLTIGFFQKNFKFYSSIRKWIRNGPFSGLHLLGILDRLRLLNLCWLSPESSSGSDMIRLSKTFIRSGHRFLNMSFHSTSLLPGRSQVVNNQRQLEKFLLDIEEILRYAVDKGWSFIPLSRALDKCNNL